MNCQKCPNWNAKLLTCKLNPDVKRDKNGTCAFNCVIESSATPIFKNLKFDDTK